MLDAAMLTPGGLWLLPVTLNFISTHVTWTWGRSIQSAAQENSNSEFPDGTAVDVSTYHIGPQEPDKVQEMAVVINSLENLGVLDSNKENCYSVDKIVKSLHKQEDKENTYMVGIYLYIKELNNNEQTVESKDSSVKHSSLQSSTEVASSSSNDSLVDSGSQDECGNLTGTAVKLNTDSRKGGQGQGSTVKVSSANSRTGSDSSTSKQPKTHEGNKMSL